MILNDEIDSVKPAKFELVLRYLAYAVVSVFLLVCFINNENIKTQTLWLIPTLFLFLFFENRISPIIRKKYGRAVKKDFIYLLDVVILALLISSIHFLLIPSILAICITILFAAIRRVSVLSFIISPVIFIGIFYFANYVFFGRIHIYHDADQVVDLVSVFLFMIYVAFCLYFQMNEMAKIEKNKNEIKAELQRYVRLNNQLSKYAPLQLWQSIMRGESEAKIAYQRRKMTIFFSDIQGFTALSETLIPDDMAFLLNDYLKNMTEIAKLYGATVDKFLGDGLLIFFGAPASRGEKEDAIACLDMALAMRQQMRILRERWVKLGYESLHIRMGISTGYCHVGNYGSNNRMSYTIIGRDANLAARLQAAAEIDQIVISQDTFNLVREEFLCVHHQPLALKGINGLVDCWQVIDRYHEDIEKYRRWYDFEKKGFNLLLNIDEVPVSDYKQLIDIMENVVNRIKLQQAKTDSSGAVPLEKKDIVTPIDVQPEFKPDE